MTEVAKSDENVTSIKKINDDKIIDISHDDLMTIQNIDNIDDHNYFVKNLFALFDKATTDIDFLIKIRKEAIRNSLFYYISVGPSEEFYEYDSENKKHVFLGIMSALNIFDTKLPACLNDFMSDNNIDYDTRNKAFVLIAELLVGGSIKDKWLITYIKKMSSDIFMLDGQPNPNLPEFCGHHKRSSEDFTSLLKLNEHATKGLRILSHMLTLNHPKEGTHLSRFAAYIVEMLTNRDTLVYNRALFKVHRKSEKRFCITDNEQDVLGVGPDTNAQEYMLEKFGISVDDDDLGGEALLRSIYNNTDIYMLVRDLFLEVVSWLSVVEEHAKAVKKKVKRLAKDITLELDIQGKDKPLSLIRLENSIREAVFEEAIDVLSKLKEKSPSSFEEQAED